MTRRKEEATLSVSNPVVAKPATAKDLVAAIRKNGLIGMWKDRTDIGDSSKFARKLRKQASRR
jgi:hypothetical protein